MWCFYMIQFRTCIVLITFSNYLEIYISFYKLLLNITKCHIKSNLSINEFQKISSLKIQSFFEILVVYLLSSSLAGTNAYIYGIFFLQVYLFIPVTFVLGCVFMIVVSFWAAPFECLVGSSIILTGIPAYLLGYKWKKPHVVKKMLGEWDIFCFSIASLSICSGKAREAFITVCYEIHMRICAWVELRALIHLVCLCSRCGGLKPRCCSRV